MTVGKALDHFSELIKSNPTVSAHVIRANLYLLKGQREEALKDAAEAIRLNPADAEPYVIRGTIREQKGEHEAALADFDQAIRLAPEQPAAYNSRAWLLATSSDTEHRNAEEAIRSAKIAVELTASKDHRYMDTLAAAYAEAGQFSEAVKWQSKASDLAPQPVEQYYRAQLELYASGKPYRQHPEQSQNLK